MNSTTPKTIKKNRHRAGKKKRAKILKAQQKALERAFEEIENFVGYPLEHTPLPPPVTDAPPGRAISSLDLFQEDTVPLENYNQLTSNAPEIITLSDSDHDSPELEPLDPTAEYHSDAVAQIIIFPPEN
ncbi:uncharacterized protein LOC118648867 [Monomorium pharaonis]|uniref:uncharacterized protein LOC118644748 n=1 Tax=Monomorium pharaonis TaxID=307658 RepID=UPI001746846B|nr:uncharacterized protein LOC118644748 [Monomorium pharaonis]XP_036139969.1 uncharacterized protein LOC118644748 [Monomorium pharaonis]XP_036145163.1 uncharacterized protein LOC118646418 [Monomorium pharaonis]XP_036145167.1 uncharacterized protein LOC118646418 [Monomorium pharaonis]XP_036151257.1 uncharacterized protein LOC118648866 [Monomorium pharaonis]XP_036151258.1 uncharacterized protein LOC118648867 [Monomorium pharaonis]XP_036151259.1 uncharacterized protein LOC118648867 [Monomorium p